MEEIWVFGRGGKLEGPSISFLSQKMDLMDILGYLSVLKFGI